MSTTPRTTPAPDQPPQPVLDLVGVGFGPSNLALAVAVEEHNRRCAPHEQLHARFVEHHPQLSWHGGMLIDGMTLQVAFLKDLVTLRDPTSDYSFLSYLQEQGRLADFVNHQSLFPSRVEFHDYLTWAAARLAAPVDYGRDVVAVQPAADHEGTLLDVHTQPADHSEPADQVLRTRNVIFGTGLAQYLPDDVEAGPRIWHSRELLPRMADLPAPTHGRFVVVGAGQSAAEAVAHLHSTYPHAQVHAVFSRYGFSPADDSPFANRVFDAAAVDDFHQAPTDVRDRLLSYHRNTNYSVVDSDLIHELYRREYQERVTGRRRLMMRRVSRVVDTTELADGVRVRVLDQVSGQHDDLECDAVVYATGYRPRDLAPLLGDLDAACLRDDDGHLQVQRDYRIATTPDLHAGLYLHGGTEHSHGLSSSLLSNIAVRAGEIVAALRPGSYAAPLNGTQLNGTDLSGVDELALIGGPA